MILPHCLYCDSMYSSIPQTPADFPIDHSEWTLKFVEIIDLGI